MRKMPSNRFYCEDVPLFAMFCKSTLNITFLPEQRWYKKNVLTVKARRPGMTNRNYPINPMFFVIHHQRYKDLRMQASEVTSVSSTKQVAISSTRSHQFTFVLVMPPAPGVPYMRINTMIEWPL